MIRFEDGMTLFHGSFCEVREPDLNKCAKFKDFGQGLYLTSSREQAERFVPISLKKAINQRIIAPTQKYGYITEFRLHNSEHLNYKEYSDADIDWLHCVVGHRKSGTFNELVSELSFYDVISGKIANDQTNATIVLYLSEAFGEVGSEFADNTCISMLIPERLKNQYCFRTNKSFESLDFIRSEKVWIRT